MCLMHLAYEINYNGRFWIFMPTYSPMCVSLQLRLKLNSFIIFTTMINLTTLKNWIIPVKTVVVRTAVTAPGMGSRRSQWWHCQPDAPHTTRIWFGVVQHWQPGLSMHLEYRIIIHWLLQVLWQNALFDTSRWYFIFPCWLMLCCLISSDAESGFCCLHLAVRECMHVCVCVIQLMYKVIFKISLTTPLLNKSQSLSSGQVRSLAGVHHCVVFSPTVSAQHPLSLLLPSSQSVETHCATMITIAKLQWYHNQLWMKERLPVNAPTLGEDHWYCLFLCVWRGFCSLACSYADYHTMYCALVIVIYLSYTTCIVTQEMKAPSSFWNLPDF